ncbi:hypothetical protein L6R21_05855 [bacterium]|nr:hypothetical protein [bacterium]
MPVIESLLNHLLREDPLRGLPVFSFPTQSLAHALKNATIVRPGATIFQKIFEVSTRHRGLHTKENNQMIQMTK